MADECYDCCKVSVGLYSHLMCLLYCALSCVVVVAMMSFNCSVVLNICGGGSPSGWSKHTGVQTCVCAFVCVQNHACVCVSCAKCVMMCLNSPEWLGKSDMIEVRSHLPKDSQFPDVLVVFTDEGIRWLLTHLEIVNLFG